MQFNEYVKDILETRYYKKTRSGEIVEDWGGLCKRVSTVIAGVENSPAMIEKYQEKFFNMLHDLKFLPNSPTLMGAGDPRLTLSACFVLGIEDTTTGIFNTIKDAGIVTKWGGGFGIDFSKLRPEDFLVGSRGGVASGPISFMHLFDSMINVMKQGGTRKGAMMASLRDGHPDIFKFIRCKNNGNLCNMNLSVTSTRSFMQRVEDKKPWELRFNSHTETVQADEIFNAICENAWQTGDPGMLFIDRMNQDNPVRGEKVKTSNPCITGDTLIMTKQGQKKVTDLIGKKSELIINGYPFYTSEEGFFETGKRWTFEIKTLEGNSIRATADHLFAVNAEKKLNMRGYKNIHWMEVRDLKEGSLIVMNSYNHDDYKVNYNIIKTIMPYDYETVYDVNVPGINAFDANGFYVHNCGELPLINNGACNLGSIDVSKFVHNGKTDWVELGEVTKTAVRFLDNVIDANNYPTEAISDTVKRYRIIGLGIMGFADYLIKKVIRYGSEESINEINELLTFIRVYAETATYNLGKEKGNFPALRKTTFKGKIKHRRNAGLMAIAPTGTISMIAGCSSGIEPYYSYEPYSRTTNEGKTLIMENPWVVAGVYHPSDPIYVSSMQIPYQDHIAIQSNAQNHVDGGISKTINLHNSATIENVKDAFMLAWRSGCKGITVFRDGCKKAGLFKELCPECQSEIVKVESCKKCLKCGWSACSVA